MHIQQQIGLKVQRTLGKGSFATVYYCINPSLKDVFAVKVFHKKDFTKTKLNSFRKQAEILQSIQHRNVVKFHSFRETQNCLYLIMEYIPGCTLKNLMDQRWKDNNPFSDPQVSKIIKYLLEGIQYLHKYNIIHRDLKPGMYFQKYENILVADPGDFSTLKIVDFGLSAQIDNNYPKNVKAQCGTLLYMAPEIIYQPSYNKSVDLWSCAIIMFLLYRQGKHPIYEQGMKSDQFKQKLKTCKFPELQNSLAQNFIKRISKIDYSQRYSVNEALQHPWITRNNQDEIPLSVNESIQSFDTSHQVKNIMNVFFYVGKQINKGQWKVPSSYKNKISEFTQTHNHYRSRSPSFKKMGKKTQQVFIKIREILNHQPHEPKEKDIESQVSSPVLRRHEKLYLRLFQKGKTVELDEVPKKKNFLLDLCKPIPVRNIQNNENQHEYCFEKKQQEHVFQEVQETKSKKEIEQVEKYASNLEINSPYRKKSERKDKLVNRFHLSRIQCQSKVDTNLGNMRGKIYKKNSIELKDYASKKSSRKKLEKQELELELGVSSPKKPQTAIGSRNTFTSKSRNRPMTFGMNSLYN